MTDQMKRAYFAYGSNMNPRQMRERCPGAEPVGIAHLSGYRFVINTRGVATIAAEEGRTVIGVVWLINEDHERTLDRCEGVAEGWYYRDSVLVQTELEEVEALVYIDPEADHGKPYEGYLERILEGAAHFALPDDYIEQLKSWARV